MIASIVLSTLNQPIKSIARDRKVLVLCRAVWITHLWGTDARMLPFLVLCLSVYGKVMEMAVFKGEMVLQAKQTALKVSGIKEG